MTKELQAILVKEVATKINKLINIPFMSEKQEQILFEAIVQVVLELIFSSLFLGIDQKVSEAKEKK